MISWAWFIFLQAALYIRSSVVVATFHLTVHKKVERRKSGGDRDHARLCHFVAAAPRDDLTDDINKDHYIIDTQQQESSTVAESSSFTNLPRLYVGDPCLLDQRSPLCHGSVVALSEDQSHYVTKVLRLGKATKPRSSMIRVFDGISGEWLATVVDNEDQNDVDDGKKRRRRRGDVSALVRVRCMKELRSIAKESSLIVGPTLYVCVIKNKNRMKWMLEKCTELGVQRVVGIQSDYTESAALSDMERSLDKFRLVVIEAAEQCERLTVPHVEVSSLKVKDLVRDRSAIQEWTSAAALLICRERSAAFCQSVVQVLKGLAKSGHDGRPISFLVGPEGGWSKEEESLFDAACVDANTEGNSIHSVSLGTSVLRAETAAMTAIASHHLIFLA